MQILIPIDLSEVSLNAFGYALKKFPQASFTVLHVISSMVNVKYPLEIAAGIQPEDALIHDLEKSIMDYMNISEIPSYIDCVVYCGEPVNVISNYVKNNSFDCVFIGARDNYSLLDKIFGTVALGVIKSCRLPIFVIPKFARCQNCAKILVASDEHLKDSEMLLSIDFWNAENAHVKFLHVKNSVTDDFVKIKDALVSNYYEQRQSSFSFEISEVKSKNISEALLKNAYNYNADLLISLAKNAGFLQTLIFKSISKELLLKSAIPMLFLHP